MKHKKGNKNSYGVSSYSSCNPSFIGFQYKSKKIVDAFKVSMKRTPYQLLIRCSQKVF